MARTDPLAGLTTTERRRKEREDARYIAAKMQGRMVGSAAAIAIAGNTFAGTREFAPGMLQPYQPADPEPPDVAICARVDLDHPIYFADNLFAQCADCGCDLQYRPAVPPKAEKLCLCCCAERLREEPTPGDDGTARARR